MKKSLMAAATIAFLSACSSGRNYALAIVALVDVSGTYVDQKQDVINVIKRGILPKMNPGDSLFVIRIDDESYKKSSLEGGMTLDIRPSKANAQKMAFAAKLDEFAKKRERVRHTDIRGAMMLGAEYLKETGAGSQTMVVFSDLEEDLPKGVKRTLAPDEFRGMRVLAMNVKKLNADNANPTAFRARLASWQKQVTSHGGKEFKVVMDPEKLDELLDH